MLNDFISSFNILKPHSPIHNNKQKPLFVLLSLLIIISLFTIFTFLMFSQMNKLQNIIQVNHDMEINENETENENENDKDNFEFIFYFEEEEEKQGEKSERQSKLEYLKSRNCKLFVISSEFDLSQKQRIDPIQIVYNKKIIQKFNIKSRFNSIKIFLQCDNDSQDKIYLSDLPKFKCLFKFYKINLFNNKQLYSLDNNFEMNVEYGSKFFLNIEKVLVIEDNNFFSSVLNDDYLNEKIKNNKEYKLVLNKLPMLFDKYNENSIDKSKNSIANFILAEMKISVPSYYNIYIRVYKKFFEIFPLYFIFFLISLFSISFIFNIFLNQYKSFQDINNFFDMKYVESDIPIDSHLNKTRDKGIYRTVTTNYKSNTNNSNKSSDSDNEKDNDNDNEREGIKKMKTIDELKSSFDLKIHIEDEKDNINDKQNVSFKSNSCDFSRSMIKFHKFSFKFTDLLKMYCCLCMKKTRTKRNIYENCMSQLDYYNNCHYYYQLCSLNEKKVVSSINNKAYSVCINSDFSNFSMQRLGFEEDLQKNNQSFYEVRRRFELSFNK